MFEQGVRQIGECIAVKKLDQLKATVQKPQFEIHYRIQELCRVPGALGEAPKTLDKGFVEWYTRQTTLGKRFISKR